jgi:hypothetical protein
MRAFKKASQAAAIKRLLNNKKIRLYHDVLTQPHEQCNCRNKGKGNQGGG